MPKWQNIICTLHITLCHLTCDPGGIRTHDPQLRRLLLYPTELLDLLNGYPAELPDPVTGCKSSELLFFNKEPALILRNPKFAGAVLKK